MPSTSDQIKLIQVDAIADLQPMLGKDIHEFLTNLGQPTWITIPGIDKTRSRAVVTLLHANEPSGLRALHDLLSSGTEPHTNLGIFVASVEAALHPPEFSHRYLPNEEDLNRCFGQSPKTNQHELANKFVRILSTYAPEAVVDTHNTSGHSEPFAVATNSSTQTRQISQLFSKRLVVISQTLGTLIEQEVGCPIVTVEFGGFLDPNSDEAAHASLEQFITKKQLFHIEAEQIQILDSPMRLQVVPGSKLEYASSVEFDDHLIMFNTIDQLNFKRLTAGTRIGWIGQGHFKHLIVNDLNQKNIAEQLFTSEAGVLSTRVPMTIFMATTDAHIAEHDCLLYLCPEDET